MEEVQPVFKKRARSSHAKTQTLVEDVSQDTGANVAKRQKSLPQSLAQSLVQSVKAKDAHGTEVDDVVINHAFASNRSLVSDSLKNSVTAEAFVDGNVTSYKESGLSIGAVFVADGKEVRTGEILGGDVAETLEEIESRHKEYKGISGYQTIIQTSRQKTKIGPNKPSANIRAISRMDYQPDICKDYKETGFCGYGDACKFLHDRGDYKSGWELDREFNKEQIERVKRLQGGFVEPSENLEITAESDLPFACHLCRKDFVSPVVTKCNHYFCSKCILQRHAKDSKCPICREQTLGIFNTAFDLIKKLKAKKENCEIISQSAVETVPSTAPGWAIP